MPYRSPCSAVTKERKATEAKRMNESSKRRLMMGLQGTKANRQARAEPVLSTGVDLEDQTLANRLRQLNARSAPSSAAEANSAPRRAPTFEASASKAVGKRLFIVNLEAEPMPKHGRQAELQKVVLAAEDDDNLAAPVTLACPSKTIQFANHMILGSKMELSEIDELPKKLLREEGSRAFRLQASASMDMWLCMRRAINTAKRAKKVYEDGRAKVAEAGKALQDHANLLKDNNDSEGCRGCKGYGACGSRVVRASQSGGDRCCRPRGDQKLPFVNQVLHPARQEGGSEMTNLLYRFKKYNPGRKLNLNFIADPPPLPEGLTEEMIED
ncbi:unnamed protein product [Prunus armeniaca]